MLEWTVHLLSIQSDFTLEEQSENVLELQNLRILLKITKFSKLCRFCCSCFVSQKHTCMQNLGIIWRETEPSHQICMWPLPAHPQGTNEIHRWLKLMRCDYLQPSWMVLELLWLSLPRSLMVDLLRQYITTERLGQARNLTNVDWSSVSFDI